MLSIDLEEEDLDARFETRVRFGLLVETAVLEVALSADGDGELHRCVVDDYVTHGDIDSEKAWHRQTVAKHKMRMAKVRCCCFMVVRVVVCGVTLGRGTPSMLPPRMRIADIPEILEYHGEK
eukprot:scaffold797_cov191-Alexandrium_tamarense.AAC.2